MPHVAKDGQHQYDRQAARRAPACSKPADAQSSFRIATGYDDGSAWVIDDATVYSPNSRGSVKHPHDFETSAVADAPWRRTTSPTGRRQATHSASSSLPSDRLAACLVTVRLFRSRVQAPLPKTPSPPHTPEVAVSESPLLAAARNSHEASRSTLVEALKSEVIRHVLSSCPQAGWLIIDVIDWYDKPNDLDVDLRAVLDADGSAIYEWTDGPALPGLPPHAWTRRVEELVTEIGDIDGTGSWSEVCGSPEYECYLRSVPLTPATEATEATYHHEHDDVAETESAGDLLRTALCEAGHTVRINHEFHSGAEAVVVTVPSGGEVWIHDGCAGISHSPRHHGGWCAEFYADPDSDCERGQDLNASPQEDFTTDTSAVVNAVTDFIRGAAR